MPDAPSTGTRTTGSDCHAVAALVAYDGSSFAGFAAQPGQKTVQSVLEDALGIALRRPVLLAVAGRTDSGVHALGQVVSFPAQGDAPDLGELRRSVNALVCDGVIIRAMQFAVPQFSARFDAVAREYRYRIGNGDAPPLFTAGVSWRVRKPLDVDAMYTASRCLLGENDFRSFCLSASSVGQRTFRRLDLIEFAWEEHLGEPCLTVRIVGNAFLHSMVRVIMGTLVEVGTGRRKPEWVAEVLAAQGRVHAGPTAPAQGLTLWSVSYRPGVGVGDGFLG